MESMGTRGIHVVVVVVVVVVVSLSPKPDRFRSPLQKPQEQTHNHTVDWVNPV
jgi:hypothetical protein